MKNNKRKKRIVFKRWFESVIAFIMVMCIMLVLCSIDSEWNLTYLKFVIFNVSIAFINYKLLKKYGTYYLQIEED